jgi:hypothetical protein
MMGEGFSFSYLDNKQVLAPVRYGKMSFRLESSTDGDGSVEVTSPYHPLCPRF